MIAARNAFRLPFGAPQPAAPGNTFLPKNAGARHGRLGRGFAPQRGSQASSRMPPMSG